MLLPFSQPAVLLSPPTSASPFDHCERHPPSPMTAIDTVYTSALSILERCGHGPAAMEGYGVIADDVGGCGLWSVEEGRYGLDCSCACAEASARFCTEASRKSTCRSNRLRRSFRRARRRRVDASATDTQAREKTTDQAGEHRGQWRGEVGEGRGGGWGWCGWRVSEEGGSLTEVVEEGDDFADVVLNVGDEVAGVPVGLDAARHGGVREQSSPSARHPLCSPHRWVGGGGAQLRSRLSAPPTTTSSRAAVCGSPCSCRGCHLT